MTEQQKFQQFLSEIREWVIVVGSRARNTHNAFSDLDMYICTKNVPYRTCEDADTFIDWIEEKVEDYGYEYSIVDGHILHVTGTPIPLDMSNYFHVCEESHERFEIDVDGVQMSAVLDGYGNLAAA